MILKSIKIAKITKFLAARNSNRWSFLMGKLIKVRNLQKVFEMI
jgi:hypothetical protein